MNDFFKSVGSHITPLSADHILFQQLYDVPDEYLVSVCDMERRLSKVDKATGPDSIPALVLRDFAHTLAGHRSLMALFMKENSHVKGKYCTQFACHRSTHRYPSKVT